MTKIVINRCSRGELISAAGLAEYARRKGLATPPALADIDRSDTDFVSMFEEDGSKRIWAGECSRASIITIPDAIKWSVKNRGLFEWVVAEPSNG